MCHNTSIWCTLSFCIGLHNLQELFCSLNVQYCNTGELLVTVETGWFLSCVNSDSEGEGKAVSHKVFISQEVLHKMHYYCKVA